MAMMKNEATMRTTTQPTDMHSNFNLIDLDTEAAWQAVLSKDPLMEGRFVYAVRTTGVFCRPTCPSRRPHRKNVSFFSTSAEAESSGFRACLRCTPKGTATNTGAALVARMCSFIDEHLDDRVTLDAAARSMTPGSIPVQLFMNHRQNNLA